MVNKTKDTVVKPTSQEKIPDEVFLKLNAEEAETVKEILGNYTYAYRSDTEVDCKRELVRRDLVGKYPYAPTAPDPSLVNPVFDWTANKWRSQYDETSKYEEIYQEVVKLKQNNETNDEQMNTLIKASAGSNQNIVMLGTKFNEFGKQVMGSLKEVVASVKELKEKIDNSDEKPASSETKTNTEKEENSEGGKE